VQTEQQDFWPAEEDTHRQQRKPHRWRALLIPCLLALGCSAVQAQSVQVLHWWKSLSEQQAVNLLTTKLAQDNLQWRDGLVPSGSGVGASIVLKSRILAGNAPEAAQLNGVLVSEWAELGLLLDIDNVAQTGKWEKVCFKVWNLIQVKNHVVAAPLGIHRINTLFYNKKIFSKLD
jgi:glucose/mannose transport system substrate-binding protein